MAEEEQQATLRETLTEAYAEHVENTEPAPQVEKPAAPSQEAADKKPADQVDDKPGRTAGRARDEHGRLLPGPAKKDETASPAQQGKASATVESPETSPVAAPIPRPSSWEKAMWPVWDKLNKGEALTAQEARQLAEYTGKREGDYAKGVSTYKNEWERAKPLLDVIAPHQELFKQHGIDPAQQISKYIEIHKGLALGSPEQKLGMLLRIAQDYKIPVESLFVQGQDGKVYFNPQVQPHQPQQQAQQPDVKSLVRQELMQERTTQLIAEFEAQASEKYPHYETVKQTMAQLLESGLATDLPSAYEASLRMPQHSQIFDQLQEQKRVADEAEKARKAKEETDRARRNAVSTRTVTPAGKSVSDKKGLRATLEEAYDQHTASRV